VSDVDLRDFLTGSIIRVPGRPRTEDNDLIYSISTKHEKMFSFVEFYSPHDADIACSIDGIMFNNSPLKIRRPKDYLQVLYVFIFKVL
jgi:splicing factor U2AF subunit